MACKPRKNPAVEVDHPLCHIDGISVVMEWDEATGSWMTFVKELNDISTFGSTREEALDHTVDLILGYIDSMEDRGYKVKLSRSTVDALRRTARAA